MSCSACSVLDRVYFVNYLLSQVECQINKFSGFAMTVFTS